MISAAATVDEYLQGLPEAERAVFERLRALFRKGGAKVEESMAYRMPTYRVGETMVGAFNRQKQSFCLYLNPAAVDPCRKELEQLGLDCGKSCIRFKRPGDLPLKLAGTLIRTAVRLARG
jgi:uncharacterized protein YdhG (YjbR/CyaY superfamily)